MSTSYSTRVSQTSSPTYHYSPIIEQGRIRLILLQPATNLDDDLKCSLISITLEACEVDLAEHYIALSYVWGSANDTRTISIDGSLLKITASLDSALRHIRHNHKILRVWADAICINQKDFDERSLQTQQMGSIYSFAWRTIIFLGTSSPECDTLLSFIRSRESRISNAASATNHTPKDLQLILENHILTRSWFGRVWVLQELVLSPDPWIQCGKSRIRWDWFCGHISQSESASSKSKGLEKLLSMDEIRPGFSEVIRPVPDMPGAGLLGLLLARQGSGVTDPRDMIYGHLGLVDKETRDLIPVNYADSVIQVYEDLAVLYLSGKSAILPFQLVGDTALDQDRGGLPSWVPNWMSLPTSVPETDTADSPELGLFSTKIPRFLAVHGWRYTTITKMIPKSAWPAVDNKSLLSTAEDFIDWLSAPNSGALDLLKAVFETNLLSSTDYSMDLGLGRDPNLEPIRIFLQPVISEWQQDFGTADGNPVMSSIRMREVIGCLFRRLQSYSLAYEEGNQVALLDGGGLIAVPSSVKIGDIIVSPYATAKKPYLFLRSQDNTIAMDEGSIISIKEDISKKSQRTQEHNGPVDINFANFTIQHCKFLTCFTEVGWMVFSTRWKTDRIFIIH